MIRAVRIGILGYIDFLFAVGAVRVNAAENL